MTEKEREARRVGNLAEKRRDEQRRPAFDGLQEHINPPKPAPRRREIHHRARRY